MRAKRLRAVVARALVASLVLAAGFACSSTTGSSQDFAEQVEAAPSQPMVGSVALGLEIAPGVGIQQVLYLVTGNGIEPLMGAIDISVDGSTASAHLGPIPAGEAYGLELTAESEDGDVTCQGGATFDVSAGQTTELRVVLSCRSEDDTGSIDVEITFNQCPVITQFSVAPLATRHGNPIRLRSQATDTDGDVPTYAWSAVPDEDAFDDPSADDTDFSCGVRGDYALTLTVSDGACEDHESVVVTCFPPACGNLVLEPGEECDDGNVSSCDGCNELCQVEGCGNGRVDCDASSGEVEECDDGNLDACDGCDGTCQVEACGNGRVECLEQCDGATDCDAECLLLALPQCGNQVLEPGEECDDGNQDACDGCDGICRVEACGNGRLECSEQCDGAADCDAECLLVALAECGNRVLEPGEECDDGNLDACDGCDAVCRVEATACRDVVPE